MPPSHSRFPDHKLHHQGRIQLLAGYARHRTSYARGGDEALAAEIDRDLSRIASRNLGRDAPSAPPARGPKRARSRDASASARAPRGASAPPADVFKRRTRRTKIGCKASRTTFRRAGAAAGPMIFDSCSGCRAGTANRARASARANMPPQKRGRLSHQCLAKTWPSRTSREVGRVRRAPAPGRRAAALATPPASGPPVDAREPP